MSGNIFHRKRRSKGIALVIVIGLVMVLALLAWVILALSGSHYHTTVAQIKRAKAYYLAEAGIQHALWGIRTGNITPPVTDYTHPVATPEGNVNVTIDIATHTGGLGVDWDITASVDPEPLRIK